MLGEGGRQYAVLGLPVPLSRLEVQADACSASHCTIVSVAIVCTRTMCCHGCSHGSDWQFWSWLDHSVVDIPYPAKPERALCQGTRHIAEHLRTVSH